MKERPILFSAPMVRAILNGTKTQTRRIWKMPPGMGWYVSGALKGEETGDICDLTGPGWCSVDEVTCPYGGPGDRLWVRETWARTKVNQDHTERDWFVYAVSDNTTDYAGPWKPSIHMPRAASRITLEITSVRVERLQDVSEPDAEAEGCERMDFEPEAHDWKICPKCGGTRLHNAIGSGGGVIFDVDCTECDSYVKRYRHLWESINGPGSWDLNPWVWVVEFNLITPKE